MEKILLAKHCKWTEKLTSNPDAGLSSLGSTPGLGYFIMFLGKALYSDGASLHPGIQMSSSKFNTEVTLEWTS